METIQLTGTFKIDKGNKVKDPLATILRINYDYEAMMVTVTVLMENGQYSLVRELDPFAFVDVITISDIKNALINQFTLKKV